MHHGTTQFVDGDIFTRNGLHHLRTGEKHVAVLLGHEDEVGECGAVDSATGTGAEDSTNLGNHAAGKDVALENLGIAGQRIATLLNTGSTGVVHTNDGGTGLHGLVHDFAYLEGHGLAQATSEDGEILCKDIDGTAFDGTVAGHHTVAQEGLFLHVEIGAAVSEEHVELFERTLVDEKSDTLTGSQFALLMLFVDALLATAHFGFTSFVKKFFYFFFKCHYLKYFLVIIMGVGPGLSVHFLVPENSLGLRIRGGMWRDP